MLQRFTLNQSGNNVRFAEAVEFIFRWIIEAMKQRLASRRLGVRALSVIPFLVESCLRDFTEPAVFGGAVAK